MLEGYHETADVYAFIRNELGKHPPFCNKNVKLTLFGIIRRVFYRKIEPIEELSIASRRHYVAGMLNVSELISTTVEFRWRTSERLARFSVDQKRPRLRQQIIYDAYDWWTALALLEKLIAWCTVPYIRRGQPRPSKSLFAFPDTIIKIFSLHQRITIWFVPLSFAKSTICIYIYIVSQKFSI